MAHIYYANGEIKEVTPKNGTDFQLEELQEIVGGNIWVIGLLEDAEQRIIVMNAEGKLNGLQENEKATELAMNKKDVSKYSEMYIKIKRRMDNIQMSMIYGLNNEDKAFLELASELLK